MALIPQQDVIKVSGLTDKIIQLLNEELDSYPDVRIISISHQQNGQFSTIVAVLETI